MNEYIMQPNQLQPSLEIAHNNDPNDFANIFLLLAESRRADMHNYAHEGELEKAAASAEMVRALYVCYNSVVAEREKDMLRT